MASGAASARFESNVAVRPGTPKLKVAVAVCPGDLTRFQQSDPGFLKGSIR